MTILIEKPKLGMTLINILFCDLFLNLSLEKQSLINLHFDFNV